MDDVAYMRQAVALARRGTGWTAPNPLVGAVVVKDGKVIGRGYHARCGGLHAERAALADCTVSPRGATMYVTLEPCCHQGRQPPCTDAILTAGIARVVVGSDDPNPLVAGKGLEILRRGGVEVVSGVLREACDALNPVFFHFIRTKRPYVVMKYAMTMDGKIATRTGASRWITGEAARRRVHRDRHRYTAIMAGVGTVLADDPMLNCRIKGGKNPVRIICDTHLRTPLTSQIVRTAGEIPTILATCAEPSLYGPYLDAHCQVWTLPERDGRVDLDALMDRLGSAGIDSVLLEGGGTLNWAALESGIVQRVQAYVAPKLFGGDAKSPVEGQGVALPDQAVALKNTRISRVGEDILLESEVDGSVYGNR
ncbi:MAG: bifunctional diaminohydroxyphosphoribosylaminopyrimidine deaminase/5-amino-6-(5-phosphoribosylamino)uracil reductase RibD [Dysosmobacter sp.]|jgi:diaminohydroxyphosphoribosylaminopyrimidine deaminase/5-amino-6-(5-phosphoribosylamino)uracil reductase|uniref:bifunctional diaminohydroxyphosphoribosylaminopyrimidine deaminase/5-amino-6-(5-phosphoribosylamino)uracil reductase RibD n=1 Tax=Dysosmobacter sp. TaxID=2591382 RepID=UPI003D910D5E